MTSIVITGQNRHARCLERLINTHSTSARAAAYDDRRTPSLLAAAANAFVADACITIGGHEPKALIRAVCELRRHPVIHVWAPADVRSIAQAPADLEAVRLLSVIHWCFDARLVADLAALGIVAKCIPLAAERITAEVRIAVDAMHAGHAVRPRRYVAISGSPLFSARVANNCRAYGRAAPVLLRTQTKGDAAVSLLALLRSSAWYSIGQSSGPAALEIAAYATGKRRIVHWLANDVTELGANRTLTRRLRSPRFVHLAQDEEVARHLNQFGLHATIVPVPAIPRVEAIRPLPARFTLLLYLPANRPEFYGRHQYERLMRGLAGEPVRYIIVGGGRIDVPHGVDAEQIGWRHDLGAIYERSSVLVRFTQSDSFSVMVVEALLHGRHVLWSNRFPFVTPLRNFHDLEGGVRSLLALHEQGALAPRRDAAAAMSQVYSPEACLKSVEAVLQRR